MPNRRPQSRAGYLVAEIATGFAVLAALAVSLTVMVHRHNSAAEKLDHRRGAVRVADQVLLSLQTEQIVQPARDDASVTIRRVDVAGAPEGRQWVQVHVEHRGQSATLGGLARSALLGREGVSP